MKRYVQLAYSLVCSVLVFCVCLSHTASAQSVEDFIIRSFNAEYELSNEDPQGKLAVVETLSIDFSGNNHGILRAIPSTYNDKDLSVDVTKVLRDEKNEPFIVYEENGYEIIKIGDASKTITGDHTYVIFYEVENVITFYDTHDELYWDVNGDQWPQPFVNVTTTLEAGVPLSSKGVLCFTGPYGSKDSNCRTSNESATFKVSTTKPLQPYQTLSFVAGFEKGYFTPPSWWELHRLHVIGGIAMLVQIIFVHSGFNKWKKYGKDLKGSGIIVPYYERPKGVSVLEASYVESNVSGPKAMSATIIDLAIRGYIQITETTDKKPKHELELRKIPDSLLHEEEKILVESLFDEVAIGSIIRLEDKKNSLAQTVKDISKKLDERSLAHGYYIISPLQSAKVYGKHFFFAFLALLIGFVAAQMTEGISIATGVVSFASLIVFGLLMTKRSDKGILLKEHMEGLKLFIKVAEKDRITMQDAVAAPLAKNRAKGPVFSVEFFEKLLPYAIVMDQEKTWAKSFEGLYETPPEWYRGNWNSFTTASLINGIASTSTATAMAFSPPANSGSSGFSSGGGFSGGGGGGGGGGGW